MSKVVDDVTMPMPSACLQQSAGSYVTATVGRDSCLSFVGATGCIISLGLSHLSLRGLCTQQHSYAGKLQSAGLPKDPAVEIGAALTGAL